MAFLEILVSCYSKTDLLWSNSSILKYFHVIIHLNFYYPKKYLRLMKGCYYFAFEFKFSVYILIQAVRCYPRYFIDFWFHPVVRIRILNWIFGSFLKLNWILLSVMVRLFIIIFMIYQVGYLFIMQQIRELAQMYYFILFMPHL